jgi:predicted short-subunit dehydrogenase-like oxidoreductase (DUF2520 family)
VITFRVLGPGRAGRSLTAALEATGGFRCAGLWGRARPPADAARGVDLLVVATPDAAVAAVASAVTPVESTAVVHLSGSLGLDVLDAHPRRGSLHPLVPLPDPAVGAERLRSGVTFAVAGDLITRELASALGGTPVEVGDRARPAYHAAASIAANHIVALLGQVERVAAAAGLPLEAFAGLVRAATDDAFALGPHRALTGPASRGDWATLELHRETLAGLPGSRSELAAYDAMVGLARRTAMDVGATVADTTPGAVDVAEVLEVAATAGAVQVA